MAFGLVLVWLVVVAGLTAVGAPLAAWLFPGLPRRGGAFALPVALVPLAIVTFWLGQLTFGVHTVAVAALLTLGLALLAGRSGAQPNWRAVAGGYAVFVLGFAFLLTFRAYNPAVTPLAGEQFLHYGLMQALERAPGLPPEDFWYAGKPIRYYYGSQLQVTGLSMLSGTPLRFGYNLGLATFYGVLVVAAYGLAGAIAGAAGRSFRVGGALGAFFAALGGTLTTAVRLGFGVLPDDLAREYGHLAFEAIRHAPYEEALVEQSTPATWNWFYTRYAVEGTLQEFPLYSFVKADLHGHTLSTGYIVLAAALAYSYYRLDAGERGRRLAVLLGGLGAMAGLFGFMNTWSVPTAVGLTWLAVAGADAHPTTLLPASWRVRLPAWLVTDTGQEPMATTGAGPQNPDREGGANGGWTGAHSRLRGELLRVVLALIPATLVGLLGVVIASPFVVFGDVPVNEGIGFLPPRTGLAEFLLLYGGLVVLVGTYVVWRSWPSVQRTPGMVLAGLGLAGPVGVWVLLAVDFAVLAILGPLLLGGWWLVRTDRGGFETVLVVAGFGLLLAIELVFAKIAPWPEGPARWNTALKVAVQGWTLAGVGAGVIAALVLARFWALGVAALRDVVEGAGLGRLRNLSLAGTTLAALVVVAVILTAAPFAALVTASEVGDDFEEGEALRIDALSAMERLQGDRYAAVAWLDDRAGRPTLAEAPGTEYGWMNVGSTFTGLPTIAGWDHEEKHRGPEVFAERVRDANAVFRGRWSQAVPVLREHAVRYIWVGPREREVFGEGLRDFSGRPGLSVAYENPSVTIYEVDQPALENGSAR